MGDLNSVMADYKRFVESIKDYSTKKVEDTVSSISNNTNSKYSSDDTDQRVQLTGRPTGFKVSESKNFIDGYAFANESRELIYLEFGTRRTNRENLTIRGGFKSEIDTASIAAPYKVNAPFFHKEAIQGRYYFLNTIDEEGLKFLKTFGK
jgi:hypothetical protein